MARARRRCSRHRRDREPGRAGDADREAAALPTRRVPLAQLPVEHRLGGVLADDMGLGKTLQALALVCHARESDPSVRAVPRRSHRPASSRAGSREARRFAPELSVVAVTDTLRRSGGTSTTWSKAQTSSSSPTPCCASTPTPTTASNGRACSSTRPSTPRTTAPRSTAASGTSPPVQGRDHGHADGEQPHGAVVAALDHRAGALPQPDTVRRALRRADRAQRRRRAARPAPAADQAAREAADQGAGGRRPPCEAGTGARGRARPEAPQDLRDHLQRERQKVLGLLDDVRPEPVHHPAFADAAPAAQPAPRR